MSLFRLQGKTSLMTMLDTTEFEQIGNRTTVTYTAEFSPEGAARLVGSLMPWDGDRR
jgi:hypothetical protein